MKGVCYSMIAVFLIASCSRDDVSLHQADSDDIAAYENAVLNNAEFSDQVAELQNLSDIEAIEMEKLARIEGELNSFSDHDPFVFFVIGDNEIGFRGNTYPQLLNWIERINNIESAQLEFTSGDFEEGESRLITKPEVLLLAGDINKDRAFGFSLPGDDNSVANQETNTLFNQLDEDILFLPGNGNHDWDPVQFGDGSYGHGLGGLLSNLGTANFVRSRYFRGLNNNEDISRSSHNYDRNSTWFPLTSSAEFNYSIDYKGVRFTQLNQFLQQPVAMMSIESLFNTGPAWYYPNHTSNWFQGLCDGSAELEIPHVVVQHFPVFTGDGWWNDDLGSTANELRKGYMDIFEDSHAPVMFTGHAHYYRETTVLPYGIVDHTAGYFADGYVIAVKASAEKGIYAVTHVRLDDYHLVDPGSIDASYTIPQ